MSSLYKLDVLFLLRSAIIKKHYDSEMTFAEKSVYDAIVLDIYGSLDEEVNDSVLFNTYFEDYFDDWYLNKGTISDSEQEEIDDLLIFRGLLYFKGQTVSLKELYNYTYGKYFRDSFDLRKESDRTAFLEKLNGCLGEARVAKVDADNFFPRELLLDSGEMNWLRLIPDEHKKISLCDQIEVKVSTDTDPLIFISGLEPCKIRKIKVEDGKKFTFISISDLHLGGCLIDSHGEISEDDIEKLKERLHYFVAFKKQIVEDLRKNNIEVDGIVFVGDNLNAVSGSYDKNFDKEILASNLKLSRERIFGIIKEFNEMNGYSLRFGSDLDLVGFISGNHDNTLGRELFFDVMKEFGEEVTFLGDGSGRIKINDEYILFNHPNALDWGLPITGDFFKTRRNLEHDIFHFEEYFNLCNRKYTFLDNLNLLHTLGTTPRDRIRNLTDIVNDDLRVNNPKLYKFYEPFITRGNGISGSVINPSCFEECMRIVVDSSDPTITFLEKERSAKHGISIGRFVKYGKENLNIKQMLDQRHICFMGDYLDPTLSIIGHFHSRLVNGKKVSYAKKDSSGNDGFVPVVIEESSSFIEEDRSVFTSTVCCLEIKDGVIDKIEVEPAVYVVNRNGSGYQAVRESTTTSSVYVRKKTL